MSQEKKNAQSLCESINCFEVLTKAKNLFCFLQTRPIVFVGFVDWLRLKNKVGIYRQLPSVVSQYQFRGRDNGILK